MVQTLIIVAIGLLVLTAAIHSLMGEIRLISPLMRERSGVLANAQFRFLLRLTWHMASVLWLALAVILAAVVWRPETVAHVALAATGGLFLVSGLVDAFATRFRHIGWPFLTAIGVVTLTALAMLRQA